MITINAITRREAAGTIYPGAYCTLPTNATAVKKALRSKHTRIITPPVSIRELSDHYRIELVVPGIHKEDFYITTSSSRLYVCAVIREPGLNTELPAPGTRGALSCFRRIVLLPADADPDFAEAGYEGGILHICLFKTRYPGKVGTGQIVVY